ncbi:MAG: hypothetical protein M4579_002962 [Chaenotheca gracillima]|nr:MAG: hypothetical protein M4579_002962 [Chaenotheca gracillima]
MSTQNPTLKRNLKPAPDPAELAAAHRVDPHPVHPAFQNQDPFAPPPNLPPALPPPSPFVSSPRKRKISGQPQHNFPPSSSPAAVAPMTDVTGAAVSAAPQQPAQKKSRTNTPWTPAEEQRLKTMRDNGSSWSEIAKTFPTRTEGSVKKHWYKDMHYAEFGEDEVMESILHGWEAVAVCKFANLLLQQSAALLSAIKEYEASKWKVIGQKVGKPAKACEQYAKEHFGGKV